MSIKQKEHCLLCSSANYVLIFPESQAWECWNCQSKYWIDDQARLEYMVFSSYTFQEAEQSLKDGNLIFADAGTTPND